MGKIAPLIDFQFYKQSENKFKNTRPILFTAKKKKEYLKWLHLKFRIVLWILNFELNFTWIQNDNFFLNLSGNNFKYYFNAFNLHSKEESLKLLHTEKISQWNFPWLYFTFR